MKTRQLDVTFINKTLLAITMKRPHVQTRCDSPAVPKYLQNVVDATTHSTACSYSHSVSSHHVTVELGEGLLDDTGALDDLDDVEAHGLAQRATLALSHNVPDADVPVQQHIQRP